MPAHLVVHLSGHGYGHVAQSAPVLAQLLSLEPDLTITVRSSLPADYLGSRLPPGCRLTPAEGDFGMEMVSALQVDAARSAARYARLHRHWEERVAEQARDLARLAPDLVLSNVSYLALAAAQRLGVRCAAFCSLNWADIYAHYCGKRSEASEITAAMRAAYNCAEVFLRPRPAMSMPWVQRSQSVGPIARLGRNRRPVLNERLRDRRSSHLVLIAFGGMDARLPIETWPVREDITWLIPGQWGVSRRDLVPMESLGAEFIDLLCSVDAVVTKPGYGIFAEAGCNGVPVIYLERNDWPETAYLVKWLARHGRAVEVSAAQAASGALGDAVSELISAPSPAKPTPDGAAQAAAILQRLL